MDRIWRMCRICRIRYPAHPEINDKQIAKLPLQQVNLAANRNRNRNRRREESLG